MKVLDVLHVKLEPSNMFDKGFAFNGWTVEDFIEDNEALSIDSPISQLNKELIEIGATPLNPNKDYPAPTYYALFDICIGGVKAILASDNYEKIERMGAERAYRLSLDSEVPCPKNLSYAEILKLYHYDIREVSARDYYEIKHANNVRLLEKA